MSIIYANLGAIPAKASRSRERVDPMLAYTGNAARAILAQVERLPGDRRVRTLNRILEQFQPGLAARVRRVAENLHAKGLDSKAALERGLALSLADASIERIQTMGRKAQAGVAVIPPDLGCACSLGTADTTTEAQTEERAEDVIGRMLQGVVCSPAVANSVSELVGQSEGLDAYNATRTGFAAGAAIASCPTAAPPPAPPAEPVASTDSGVVLALVGVGTLAVVGGIVWVATRKR